MRDITEDEIRKAFKEKTFSKGHAYFESGHVECGIRKGDSLIGRVSGSEIQPYKVEIEIKDEIYSECSCPVGAMCKHGVALLLQWANDKDLFVDYDNLLALLREKSKEELIRILSPILEDDPVLAQKMAFSQGIAQRKIDTAALSRRLRYIGRDLDYHAVSGIVQELEEIKERGDNLAREGHCEEAVEVYLLLIEWGVDAFENGVDDSDGNLGDVMIACVEEFSKTAKTYEEERKSDLIYRILRIVEVEDYGLETEEMLYSLVTEKNISVIEKELLRRIPTTGEKDHISYQREKILDLLSDLYEKLDMQEDSLRMMKEAGLQDENDYVRIVKVLIRLGAHEEAFRCVKEGLPLEEEDDRLHRLYFTLLHRFLVEEKREDLEVSKEEVMASALELLDSFDSGRYSVIKEVLERIGNYDEFISILKKKCEDSVVIDVLLYEDCCDEAIERALSSSTLHPGRLMDVARVAKEKGKAETVKLIGKAVKKGLSHVDGPESELLEFFVYESEEEELRKAIECIRNTFIARIFVNALMKRNQEFALVLLKKFLNDIGKEEVKAYAVRLENEYAKDLCHHWISTFIGRSHVYYDDVIDVLKVVRKMTGEEEWNNYIATFMESHKGRKKLIEKIRKLN